MFSRVTRRLKPQTKPRFINWARVRIGLTGRLLVLVIFAVVPALLIQAWNEYDLRIAREADIRKQVVQTTKQFGEEIGELREGARQLLLALAQLNTVKSHQQDACSALFSKLKTRFANYSLLGAADVDGRIFCTSELNFYSSVANQPFFTRAMAQPGLAVGNYWVDPVNDQKIFFSVPANQKQRRSLRSTAPPGAASGSSSSVFSRQSTRPGRAVEISSVAR